MRGTGGVVSEREDILQVASVVSEDGNSPRTTRLTRRQAALLGVFVAVSTLAIRIAFYDASLSLGIIVSCAVTGAIWAIGLYLGASWIEFRRST